MKVFTTSNIKNTWREATVHWCFLNKDCREDGAPPAIYVHAPYQSLVIIWGKSPFEE